MTRKKGKGTELSVFKGREAKLNRAVFQTLALKGPQTIYDIHKEVKAQKRLKRTRYASVNKRLRFLQESSYIKKTGAKQKTKAGFQASIYELTNKAYLALLLNSINLDELLMHVDGATAQTIIGVIVHMR